MINGGSPYPQGPTHKGLHPNISQEWFLYIIIAIFNDFYSTFRDFWPILCDIGPFLRPDLGGKLEDGYQLQIYIN
jgi:hypothetical protein